LRHLRGVKTFLDFVTVGVLNASQVCR
jgi:hypothetical protein